MNSDTITYDGRTLTIKEWAALTDIPAEAIRWRNNAGWPPSRTLTQRPRKYKQKKTPACGARRLQDCLNCKYEDCIAPATIRLEGE